MSCGVINVNWAANVQFHNRFFLHQGCAGIVNWADNVQLHICKYVFTLGCEGLSQNNYVALQVIALVWDGYTDVSKAPSNCPFVHYLLA